jgi:hypothetical protein
MLSWLAAMWSTAGSEPLAAAFQKSTGSSHEIIQK